jgi:hypothetical protein
MGFQFLALMRSSKDSSGISIYRLTLNEELQEEMGRSFAIPAEKWQEYSVQRAAFNEGYKLADNEIFEIKQFVLPPDILNAVRFPQEYGEFDVVAQGVSDIKGIAAVNTDGGKVTVVFKVIAKAKKLEPARNLMVMCSPKGYERQTHPGIIIDDRVAAAYVDGSLLFKSTATVKQLLSLKAYMNEASDLEIISFLEKRFETDTEKLLAVADKWMRKRFTSLMESTLFDERTALEIYDTAKSFSSEIPMELSKDRSKLIMPAEKRDIRMMLKFLNEEYYKGVLTGKDYQTSGKRPLQDAEKGSGAQFRKAGLRFSA